MEVRHCRGSDVAATSSWLSIFSRARWVVFAYGPRLLWPTSQGVFTEARSEAAAAAGWAQEDARRDWDHFLSMASMPVQLAAATCADDAVDGAGGHCSASAATAGNGGGKNAGGDQVSGA